MHKDDNILPPKIAIVGGGPRGLAAIENLNEVLAKGNPDIPINILLFEKTPYRGTGPIYALDQSPSNWLNVADRALLIQARPAIQLRDLSIPAFPSYHDWIGCTSWSDQSPAVDHYPLGFYLGQYLWERYQSIAGPLEASNRLCVVQAEVIQLKIIAGDVEVRTGNDSKYKVKEVLLTIGHQPTSFSKQILEWKKYARERMKRYAYGPPVASIQQLLALVDAGMLNLAVVNNQAITLTDQGWELSVNDVTVVADVMIDTVLDSPHLEGVCTPLVELIHY